METICKVCNRHDEINKDGLCKLCEEKEYVLEKLRKDSRKIREYIVLVEKLRYGSVSENVWHKLCETPARYTSIMEEIARAIFPKGYGFTSDSNTVKFTLNGFKVTIPKTSKTGIEIDTFWYSKYYEEEFKPICKYPKMRKYFKLLDSGNYTWKDLAKCRCNTDMTDLELFRWWWFKGKWHKVDREKWYNELQKEDKINEEKLDIWSKGKVKQEAKKVLFVETVKELERWAKVHSYYSVDDMYCTREVDGFLKKIKDE